MGHIPPYRYALIAIGLSLYSSLGHAETFVKDSASFTADAVVIRDMAAQISINNHAATEISIIWSGPKDWVQAMRPMKKDKTLILDGAKLPEVKGTMTAVSADSVSVIASGGSSASVTIGNQSTTSSNKPPTINIRLPKDTGLKLSNLVGTTSIAERNRAVEATLKSGSIQFADLAKGGKLSVLGSGSITVKHTQGALSLTIPGSGNITLENADLQSLNAGITGTGIISVQGRSQTADLAISGSGMIEIEHVSRKPKQSITGVGMISIGNTR